MRPGDRLWTKREEAALIKWFPLVGANEMSMRLKRGVPAVRVRASELGLKSCRYTAMRGNWKILLHNPYLAIPEIQKSYIAGVFDGEGYINFTKNKFWRVGIANTNKQLIDWLEGNIAGSVVYFHKSTNPKWKDDWRWTMEGNVKSRAFLMAVLPYLIVKRPKAISTIAGITTSLRLQLGRWEKYWGAA